MRIVEIFLRFLALGCVCFGGPAAHIGYFHKTFTQKLKWLSEEQYSSMVALSQFLPGPGSSQVGFSIGVHRAGIVGGIAAFIGFTLPSFLLMLGLALSLKNELYSTTVMAMIPILKLLAVVVVTDACVSMFEAFCRDKSSTSIAILSSAFILYFSNIISQLSAIGIGAIAGWLLAKSGSSEAEHSSAFELTKSQTKGLMTSINWLALIFFLALFIILPIISKWSNNLNLFALFYQTGSLVFGGGHVVLPLLQHGVESVIGTEQFLAGYAAAQAVPGPMFTLASYCGALFLNQPLLGAAIATLAIFLPGFLLIIALRDGWESLLAHPKIAGAAWGINASVVGLLAATLVNPVITTSINSSIDIAICVAAFMALRVFKLPITLVVFGFVLAAAVATNL